MKKKVVALFLCAAMMLSTMAGCSNSGKESDQNDKGAPTKEVVSGDTAKEEDTATEEEDTWSWPLSEKKELNIWIVWSNDYLENPNELKAMQVLEEKTNVHINWTAVAGTEAAEKFSLMIASGEYPDIIRGAEAYYSGGLVKMVSDGVTIELTDLIDKNMPTYNSLRKINDKLYKDTMTDEGKIVAAYTLASKSGEIAGERIWGGPDIRKDWLDETGLELPVTIDDWYAALTAIKANHPECEAPLMIGQNGVDYYGSFISAFGVLSEFYNENGTVKYGPSEAGYKEYIETFRKWYAEGLIDPNFVSNNASFMASGDFVGSGKAAAGPTVWGFTADVFTNMGYNSDENFWMTATTYPVKSVGDIPQAGAAMSELVKETTVITSACKDVELAMRYLDYCYTEESMMLNSLGIEGESYVDNGDGTYSITESLKAKVTDGTYPTMAAAVYTYSLGTSSFGLYNWAMFDAVYEGNSATAAYDVWNNAKFDLMLPPCMTMTEEETQEYASLYTSILTLVQENTVKTIMGTQSMDDYDSFVETLGSFGIDRCIELKQAALDRYNAR